MKYFKKFNEIDSNYIYTDKHIHSVWAEGRSTVREIVGKAEELGLTQIALTEHIREDSDYFCDYLEEIAEMRKECRVEILSGLEARIKNSQGDIDVSKGDLEKADIKIASVHRLPVDGKLFYPKELEKEECQAAELELSLAAVKNRKCNVLGHAGGMSLRTYDEFPQEFFESIISECAKNEVAFDLNYMYHFGILQDLKHILKKHNPFVSLGSDAHYTDELGSWLGVLRERKNNV